MSLRRTIALETTTMLLCFSTVLAPACKDSFHSDSDEGEAGETDSGDVDGDASSTSGDGDSGDGDGDSSTGDGDSGDGDGDQANSLCGERPVPFAFQSGTSVDIGGSIIALQSGHFMGSAAEDLIGIDYTNGRLVYLEGNGNGLFPTRTDAELIGTPRDFAIVDPFQNDDPHLFVHRTILMAPPAEHVTEILVMPVDPQFGTDPFGTIPTTTDGFGMEPIDLDGDGARDDLVVSGGDAQSGSNFHLDFTIGLEGAPSTTTSGVMGYMPWYMAVGDLNGDDIDDLVVSNVDEGQAIDDDTVEIYLGDGAGSMSYWATLNVGSDPRDLGLGDLDGDGDLDLALAVANFDNPQSDPDSVELWLGDGTGNFTAVGAVTVGAQPSALEVTDINCDGELDILVTAEFDNALNILLGVGDANFGELISVPVDGQIPSTIAIGDYNGDAMPDLAIGTWTSQNIALLLGSAG